MSSRAFRRLQRESEVVRIKGEVGKREEEIDEEEELVTQPGIGKRSGPSSNLFALVSSGHDVCKYSVIDNKVLV